MLVAVHPVFGMAGAASRGIGDIPTSPTTITIGSGLVPGTSVAGSQVPSVAPGTSTGTGPSGYTINADGSVTWFDALGNPITNMSAYDAAVSPGDSGVPATVANLAAAAGSNIGMIALVVAAALVLGVFVSAK